MLFIVSKPVTAGSIPRVFLRNWMNHRQWKQVGLEFVMWETEIYYIANFTWAEREENRPDVGKINNSS